MAQRGQKDLLARLADAGEEAIQRLAGTPGASGVLGVVTNMRDQVDALAKRVRGMDALERRVEDLERELEKMRKGTRKTATRARKSTAKTASRAAKTGTSRKTKSRSTRKR
jgi:hypothetical protein